MSSGHYTLETLMNLETKLEKTGCPAAYGVLVLPCHCLRVLAWLILLSVIASTVKGTVWIHI